MTKLKYAIGMLAAGAAVGGASHAAAAVITETFDYGPSLSPGTDIFLAGQTGTPQFRYRDSSLYFTKYYLDAVGSAKVDLTRYDDDALPTSSAGITSTSVQTYEAGFVPCEPFPECLVIASVPDTYWHLSFSAGGEDYLGTAHIDGGQTLREIRYDTVENLSTAPEPDAWALMILGSGAAGAALRRNRRRQLDAASA